MRSMEHRDLARMIGGRLAALRRDNVAKPSR
jgi:hypothetical protein